jgi:hypothetical protein
MNDKKNIAEFVIWWVQQGRKPGKYNNDRADAILFSMLFGTVVVGVSMAINLIIGITLAILLYVPAIGMGVYILFQYFKKNYARFQGTE